MNIHDELFSGSIFQLSAYVRKGLLSPVEMASLWCKHAAEKDKYNCFAGISPEGTVVQAFKGSPLNSHILGLPYAVSDNICLKEQNITCASGAFNYKAPFDAECVKDMRQAGAAVLGRLNMAEFGAGWNARSYANKEVLNPWNTSRTAGTCGGGAAVSARLTPAALVLDVGGNALSSASYCGVSCLKPTYGFISRHGTVSVCPSIEQLCIMARSCLDIALIAEKLLHGSKLDSTCVPSERYMELYKYMPVRLNLFKIGLASNWLEKADKQMQLAVLKAVEVFKMMGARIEEIEVPLNPLAYECVRVISCVEGMQDMLIRGQIDRLSRETQKSIILKNILITQKQGIYFKKARSVRENICRNLEQTLSDVDALICPGGYSFAPELGGNYKQDALFTAIPALTGLPALSLPCGFSQDMPLGMMILGRGHSENMLLALGNEFERASKLNLISPPLLRGEIK